MELDTDTRIALQRLAREQTKQRLLQDVLFDINVCRLEGWSWREYLKELINLLEGCMDSC